MRKRRAKNTRTFAWCEELESRHLMSAGLAAHITPAGHLRLPASVVGHSSTGSLPIRRDPSAPPPVITGPAPGSAFLDIQMAVGETFNGKLGTLDVSLPDLGSGPATSPITTVDYDSTGAATGMANLMEIKIYWGDGSSSQGTLIRNSAGTYDVYGSHTYQTAGVYETLVNPTTRPIQDPAYHGPPIAIPAHILSWGLIRTAVITVGFMALR